MKRNRRCLALLTAGVLLVSGCSKELEVKLAKAQADLAEAEAELTESRAQTEAANIEITKLKLELKRLTATAAEAGDAAVDRGTAE